jgi:hypothetical protein
MTNFETREESRRRNTKERREFIKQWAEYVRTHDDEEWAAQQHEIIDSQLESANEVALRGEFGPDSRI